MYPYYYINSTEGIELTKFNFFKKQVDPLKSFIAGGTAGAVEGIITYPFEFIKTRLQLISEIVNSIRNH